MADPATLRYFGVRGYVWLLLATALSFSIFARRAARYWRVLRTARREYRLDQLPRRLWRFVTDVLGHRKLLREPLIGAAHLLIFWTFVFFAASFFWNLTRGILPFLRIPYTDEAAWMAAALEALAILCLAALAVAAVRRYLFPPPGLERSRDATLILSLIAVVLATSLVGRLLRERSESAWLALWWVHMLTVLGFLAYLPYSKHLHLLASPFGVLFAELKPRAMPPASEGASKREEFTWRQLFGGLACAECGRCQRVCPAWLSGNILSPEKLMRKLKELVRATADADGRSFLGDDVRPEEIWECLTCYACMEACPVANEHIPVLIELRRRLVLKGEIGGRVQEALTNLGRYGNSFGLSPRHRARWMQLLDGQIKDARKEPVEYLWFTGDFASFDVRAAPMTAAAARVLQRAGVDFGTLRESELNAGNDVRRLGEEGLFEALAEKNTKALRAVKYECLITSDPHSYHALKNEYPALDGRRGVLHTSELFDGLLREGRLQVRRKLDVVATYHDPCYLGRYNGVYSAPRRTLAALGLKLVEMPRCRSRSYCCGAGGGRIWMEDTPGSGERPAESRVREAAGLPGVNTLVTACPKDLVMLQDAVKTTGLEGRLAIKDLGQLVDEATRL